MTLTLAEIDLLEDTWARAVPHDQFDLLRREAPVYWHEHPESQGFWAVTRYDDVQAVSRDHETFSAELGLDVRPGPDAGGARDDPHDDPQHGPAQAHPLPPARQCRLHAPHDRPARRQASHERAVGIVASIEGRDEIEFVEDVAAELPLQVICEMIGVPDEDRHQIFDWSNRMVGFQDPDFHTSEEDGQIAAAEIYAYCEAIAADRRANPPRRHHDGARHTPRSTATG